MFQVCSIVFIYGAIFLDTGIIKSSLYCVDYLWILRQSIDDDSQQEFVLLSLNSEVIPPTPPYVTEVVNAVVLNHRFLKS